MATTSAVAGTNRNDVAHSDDAVWARRRDGVPTDGITSRSAISRERSSNGFSTEHSTDSKPSADTMKQDKSAVYINMEKQVLNYPSARYNRLEHPADKSLLSSFFLGIIFIIVALALFCPVIGLVVILLPIAVIVRWCLDFCCCTPQNVCSCCCAKIMTNSDAYWLHDSPLNRMVVQCLLVLENGLDITRIKELLNARLIYAQSKSGRYLYPRFTHKIMPLKASYTWSCDTNFTIDDHIFAAPQGIQNSRQLQEYVSNLANTALSLAKPLWEMHIILNYGDENDTVILFRMHPCLSDGVGMVRLFLKAVVDDSLFPVAQKVNYASRAFYFNTLRALIVGPIVFFHKFIFTRKDYNIFHGAKLGEKKIVVWSEAYNMTNCTRVKQVARSAMNDVLLSVAAGTLRTYQQYFGVENPFDMLVNIPVDFRSEMRANGRVTMKNQFAIVDVPLPANTEGAIPRLWEVRHRMEELKNSADVPIRYGITTILMTIFPECVSHFILDIMYNHSSCYVSNLMGPSVEQTFASRKVKDIIYWVPPRSTVGISISFITYGPQIRMAVMADRRVVANPEILTQDFVVQMDNLVNLMANRRIPGEHSSRRHHRDLQDETPMEHSEPSVEQLRKKMSDVQKRLQEHKAQLDDAIENKFLEDQETLTEQIEQLRDEFRDMLIELRRRRSLADGGGSFCEDEDDEDGELRRTSIRRRTLSGASRRLSLVSFHASMTRPLTAPVAAVAVASAPHPPPHSHRTSISMSPPSSPSPCNSAMKEAEPVDESLSVPDLRKYLVTHDDVQNKDRPYSPQHREHSQVATTSGHDVIEPERQSDDVDLL